MATPQRARRYVPTATILASCSLHDVQRGLGHPSHVQQRLVNVRRLEYVCFVPIADIDLTKDRGRLTTLRDAIVGATRDSCTDLRRPGHSGRLFGCPTGIRGSQASTRTALARYPFARSSKRRRSSHPDSTLWHSPHGTPTATQG